MEDNRLLLEVIKTMSPKNLLSFVLDLSEESIKWQERYNKTADRLEKETGIKQFKALIETPEKNLLERFGISSDNDDDDE